METANKLSLNEAREVARRLGGRVRNMKKNADTMAERFTTLAIGGGAAALAGWFMGGLDFEKSQMTEQQIEDEGDPTGLFNIPWDLIVATGFGVAGVAGLGGRKMNASIVAAANGVFCEYVGNLTREKARQFAAPTP